MPKTRGLKLKPIKRPHFEEKSLHGPQFKTKQGFTGHSLEKILHIATNLAIFKHVLPWAQVRSSG